MYVKCTDLEKESGKGRQLQLRQRTNERSSIDFNKEIEKLKVFLEVGVDDKGAVFRANKKFYEYLESVKRKEVAASLNELKIMPPVNGYRPTVSKVPKYTAPYFPTTNTTYYLTNDYANLGVGLASGDLNNDGFDDLVIGAPVYSETNKYQNGAVFVVLADSSGSVPMMNINLEKNANSVIKPPEDSIRARFGHSVAVLDLNLDGYNDIVVSAPSYDLSNINYAVFINLFFSINNFGILILII